MADKYPAVAPVNVAPKSANTVLDAAELVAAELVAKFNWPGQFMLSDATSAVDTLFEPDWKFNETL